MRERKKFWIGLIFLAFLISGCGESGLLQITLVTEGQHALSGDIPGLLVLTGGEVVLEPTGVLEGSVYQLEGIFQLEGAVRGDVFLFGGDLSLADSARIRGNFNHGGGNITGRPEDVVSGSINEGTGLQIPDVNPPSRRTVLDTALRWIISGLILAGAALLAERRLPGNVKRVQEAVFQHSAVCGAMGILAGIVGLSLIVLLLYTIILIPVALLGFAAMVLSVIWGWLAIGIQLGKWAAVRFQGALPEKTAVAGASFLFFIVLNLLNLLPYAGGILGIAVALVSLGGVFLTRFGFRRFVPEGAS